MFVQSCWLCQPSTALATADRIPFLSVISNVAYLEFFCFSSNSVLGFDPYCLTPFWPLCHQCSWDTVAELKPRPGPSCLPESQKQKDRSQQEPVLFLLLVFHVHLGASRDTPFLLFASSPIFLSCSLLASQRGLSTLLIWTSSSSSSSSMPLERQTPTEESTCQDPVACLHTQSLPRAMLHNSQQAESFPIFLYLRQCFPHLPSLSAASQCSPKTKVLLRLALVFTGLDCLF